MVPARGGGGECVMRRRLSMDRRLSPAHACQRRSATCLANITAGCCPAGSRLEQGDVVLPAALQRLLYVRGLGPRWRVQEPGPELLSGAVAHDKWDLLLA